MSPRPTALITSPNLRRCAAIAFAFATAALAGCVNNPAAPVATAPLYAPPASGPTARLLVRVDHIGGRYTVSNFEQPVSCSRRQDFVSATVREPERQTVTLAANRLQTLSFIHERDRQACQIILSFEPRAGNTYLMRSTANADGCTVELLNATNPEAPAEERSRIRRERVGLGLSDNACKPLASTVQRQAAPGGAGPGAEARSARPADSLEPFKDLLPRK